MPRANTLLFVEPSQHYLEWSSCVVREIIQVHRKPWMEIVELRGYDAVPDKIDDALDRYDPFLFWGVGHGNVDVWSCECMQIYMAVCDARTTRMRDRIVILNSCLTGVSLGPDLISKGALSYFGSTAEFWLYIGSPPCSDRASRAVFLCEHQSVASLMDGRTTSQAQQDRLRRYDEEIEYWTTGPGRGHPHAPIIVRLLEIDKSVAVMLGRGDVRVAVPTVAPAVPFIGFLPVLFGMTVFGVHVEKYK